MKPIDETSFNEPQLQALLGPIPLQAAAMPRIRERLGREVERRRQELLEGAVYGGFAFAAVAWAFISVLPP